MIPSRDLGATSRRPPGDLGAGPRDLRRPPEGAFGYQSAPGTSHGSLRGDPGPPTARRKDANVSLRFADLRFCTPSLEFRTLWRSDLSRNAIKTNLILTILKTHCSSPFLCFSSRDGPRAPPRPLLESGLATLGSRGPPLKLGKGPLGDPGPLQGPLSG